jgi:hypothetical protein
MLNNTFEFSRDDSPQDVSGRSTSMLDGLIAAALLFTGAVVTIAWLAGLTWTASVLFAAL